MDNTQREYYRKKEDIIANAETLNACPYKIPGDFVSAQQIMDQIGKRDHVEVIDVDSMELSPVEDFDRYLTDSILINLTQRWLDSHGKEVDPALDYYYNDNFRFGLLYFQRRKIETKGVEAVDLYIYAYDRPLVYAYNPTTPNSNPEEVQALIGSWKNYEYQYNTRMDELGEEENYSSRGDYLVKNYGVVYSENGHRIFEVASRMFWGYVQLVYRLSDEHPECFGQGALVVIDKLYEYYKADLLGEWDLSRKDFELQAIRQFLYISNDEKQIRIDLFRLINSKSERADEVFTGGLYHVFDHFKGLRVSAETKGDYALDESRLLETMRDLFFSHATFKRERVDREEHCWGHEYIAEHEYDTPMTLEENGWQYARKRSKGVFILDLAKDLFYLTTLHITNT